MKKMICAITWLTLSLTVLAQQDTTGHKKPVRKAPGGKYCAALSEGKMTVTADGKPLDTDVQLKNGSKITASGTIVFKNGTIKMLKPGSCVDEEGNESEHAQK